MVQLYQPVRWCDRVHSLRAQGSKLLDCRRANISTRTRPFTGGDVATDLATLQRGRRVSHRGRRVSHRAISSGYFTFIRPLANISSRSPKVRLQMQDFRRGPYNFKITKRDSRPASSTHRNTRVIRKVLEFCKQRPVIDRVAGLNEATDRPVARNYRETRLIGLTAALVPFSMRFAVI